jgi:hypothetical protein
MVKFCIMNKIEGSPIIQHDIAVETHVDQPLTVDYAKSLDFFSFWFSQGNGDLHRNIFRSIQIQHPSWKVDRPFRHQVYRAAQKAITTYAFPNEEDFPDGDIPLRHTQTGKYGLKMGKGSYYVNGHHALELWEMVSTEADLDEGKIVKELAKGIIDADYKFLIEKGGRERSDPNPTIDYDPFMDPYLSHICYYAIEGQNAYLPEFRTMIGSVNSYLHSQEALDDEVIDQSKLKAVINKYVETHPSNDPSPFAYLLAA